MSAVRLAKATIKIPKRIERGPTDILKALAGTVRHIPSQPELSLQDDPYLLPRRPNERRIFVLSKLSGVKAARFFLNKNPELFYRDDAEPKVEAFACKEQFDRSMDFTEADIRWCIENHDPGNGVIAYEAMLERNLPLPDDMLLDFFEMMCHTNQENPKDFIDSERDRLIIHSDTNLVDMTWKKGGIAAKIFDEIKDKLDPPRVYSAMVAGLSRYNEHVAARQLFHNFKHRHPSQALYNEAYDGLIKSVLRLNSSENTISEAMNDIVEHMLVNLVKPSLMVFNSIMHVYRVSKDDEMVKQVFNLYNDMNSLGIKPSLSTMTSLILVLVKNKYDRGSQEIISSLLDYISADESLLQIRDEKDIEFLPRLMRVFSRMNDIKQAKRLHKIYQKQPFLFISHMQKRRYFDDYFKLVVTTETLDNIYKFYVSHTSYDFEPMPDSYDALAEALELYQAPEDVIDKIVDDIIAFKLVGRIKNDAIFRSKQKYLDAMDNLAR